MNAAENRLVCLVMILAFWGPAAPRLAAQDMLDVAAGQMATGQTADARVLVGSAVESATSPKQRNRALLYQAYLETDEDSASTRLELVTGLAAGQAEAISARERLGDLAFSRGEYRQALTNWLKAADTAEILKNRQNLLAKAARARLRMNNPQQAIEILERALALGRSSEYGTLYYYSGVALLACGDPEKAAEQYLAAYRFAGNPYQLAALSRLVELYGRGKSAHARQWRNRLIESTAGTVFDPAEVSSTTDRLAGPPGTYSIQLGAFSSLSRARAQAESLKHQGFDPVVLPAGSDGLYRVRILGLASRLEADEVVKKLKKNGFSYQLLSPEG